MFAAIKLYRAFSGGRVGGAVGGPEDGGCAAASDKKRLGLITRDLSPLLASLGTPIRLFAMGARG